MDFSGILFLMDNHSMSEDGNGKDGKDGNGNDKEKKEGQARRRADVPRSPWE